MAGSKGIVVCSVMPSVTRRNFHLREVPPGGVCAKGPTLCGLPAEVDYHFGLRAWGQEEMGTWCDECLEFATELSLPFFYDEVPKKA